MQEELVNYFDLFLNYMESEGNLYCRLNLPGPITSAEASGSLTALQAPPRAMPAFPTMAVITGAAPAN